MAMLRIVQITTAMSGEGEVLYGLDDQGNLYEFVRETEPRRYVEFYKDRDGHSLKYLAFGSIPAGVKLNLPPAMVSLSEMAQAWKYYDGATQGWRLLVPVSHNMETRPVKYEDLSPKPFRF